jgi:hypothetical protein
MGSWWYPLLGDDNAHLHVRVCSLEVVQGSPSFCPMDCQIPCRLLAWSWPLSECARAGSCVYFDRCCTRVLAAWRTQGCLPLTCKSLTGAGTAGRPLDKKGEQAGQLYSPRCCNCATFSRIPVPVRATKATQEYVGNAILQDPVMRGTLDGGCQLEQHTLLIVVYSVDTSADRRDHTHFQY